MFFESREREGETEIGMKSGYWIDNEIRAYLDCEFVDDMLPGHETLTRR